MGEYPIKGEPTSFQEIYNRFLGKITDDMYVELTREDTEADLYNILMDALPGFEFPRFPLFDLGKSSSITSGDTIINLDESSNDDNGLEYDLFNAHLTPEEINIIALLMYNTWLQRQVASIENTRMKYTGSDCEVLFLKKE